MRAAEAVRVYRALSDEARVRLFALVRDADRALDVPEMAEALGLHPNTIRSHLRRLEAAGLVASETEVRTSRGRPRLLFRPGPSAAEVAHGARDYKLLATMLAGHARSGASEPASVAVSTGKTWGGYLASPVRPHPGDAVDAGSAVQMIARMMERLGFEPEVKAEGSVADVLLHNCPFRAVAERYPEIVCSLHLGILRGALEETAAPVEATDLRPFVTPALCVARLEKR